jgi:hypothetical protein
MSREDVGPSPRGAAALAAAALLLSASQGLARDAATETAGETAGVPDDVAECFAAPADLDVVGGRLMDGVRLGISRGGSILEAGRRLTVAEAGDDLVARSGAAHVDQWQASVDAVTPSEDFDGCDVLEYEGPAYEAGEESNCRFSADVAVCPDSCQLYDGAWKVVCDDDTPKVIASGSFSRS